MHPGNLKYGDLNKFPFFQFRILRLESWHATGTRLLKTNEFGNYMFIVEFFVKKNADRA